MLQRHVGDVTNIGPLPRKRPLVDRARRKLSQTIYGKDFFLDRTEFSGRHYATQIEDKLTRGRFDLLFAAGATIAVAYVQSPLPLVTYADATFATMVGYYFKNLSERTIADGHRMERLALRKASKAIFASRWAADSAVNDYGTDRGKVHVVPFGANLDEVPDKPRLERGVSDPINFLFIGKEWERKGGAVACEAIRLLQSRNVNAVLHIVGCHPPFANADPTIVVHGFLDKAHPDHRRELDRLLGEADFLMCPSHEECYGLVVCEANAYGIPVLAHDTGGLSSLVVDGQNGFLSRSNTAQDYVDRVLRVIGDGSYQRLRRQARQTFVTRLNWDASGKRIAAIVAEVL